MRAALIALLCGVVVSSQSHAFGKKKPEPPKEPQDSQAYPTRVAGIGKLMDSGFQLPDGKGRVDLGAVLPELVTTEMIQATRKLRPSGSPGGAGDRFVLLGGVTSFEASAFSGSVRFGYKAGAGDIGSGTVPGGSGKIAVKVSTLGMDFHIVDTQRREVVAAGRGSATGAGGSLEVEIDFGAIRVPADFVLNSPMTPLFRSAARAAILEMATDPNTNLFMDWATVVGRVDGGIERLFLSSGIRDDIATGNLFTVYGDSDVRIGEVKVREVGLYESAASFRDDPGGKLLRSVRPGDRVLIYYVSPRNPH